MPGSPSTAPQFSYDSPGATAWWKGWTKFQWSLTKLLQYVSGKNCRLWLRRIADNSWVLMQVFEFSYWSLKTQFRLKTQCFLKTEITFPLELLFVVAHERDLILAGCLLRCYGPEWAKCPFHHIMEKNPFSMYLQQNVSAFLDHYSAETLMTS